MPGLGNFSSRPLLAGLQSVPGQATVSDKDHAREILLSAYTQEQFDAVLDVLDQEMEAAREAPRQVKQQFRDLAHGDKLGGIPTPDRPVIKYDAEGNRVQ